MDIEVLEAFSEGAPPSVVEAMRHTVANMLGTLPPAFFDVKVSTVAENLAQVMFSVMMTGYMFRNAQYRVDLSKSVMSALPVAQGGSAGGESGDAAPVGSAGGEGGDAAPVGSAGGEASLQTYAPGAQKLGVAGEVLRWNLDEEQAEAMPADDYIHLLEAEVAALRREVEEANERAKRQLPVQQPGALGAGVASTGAAGSVAAAAAGVVDVFQTPGAGVNDIVSYLQSLEPAGVQELTAGAGDDVLGAMNAFVQRLLATTSPAGLVEDPGDMVETSSADLAKLLYWLLVVGYGLRTMEVRLDMEALASPGGGGGGGDSGFSVLPGS